MSSFVKQKEAEKKGATTEEIQLATMSESAGWKILQEFIDRVEEDLDAFNLKAIENGSPLEQLGLNAIVVATTKEIIRKIINKVADAAESVNGK